MKRFLIIGLIVGVVLILVGGAGAVYAQVSGLGNNANLVITTNRNEIPNQEPFNYGPGGMMRGYGPGGMMHGYGYGYGPGGMMGGGGLGLGCSEFSGSLQNYIITAFANAVGLTTDQVNTDLSNGQSLTQIANTQGFTGDKLTQLESQVLQAALKQAVTDKVITQAQADQMLQVMKNNPGLGFGFGNCPMWNGNNSEPIYR